MDNDDRVWTLLQEVRTEQKKTNDAISSIVGRDNCDSYRKEFNKRLVAVEEVIVVYKATKFDVVNTQELQDAKAEAVHAAELACTPAITNMQKDISDIKSKLRFVDGTLFTWNTVQKSPLLKNTFYLGGLGLAMIAYGRINDAITQYGPKDVAMFISALLLLALVVWLSHGRNREKIVGAAIK
jgi:hypothetical protein